MRSRSATRRTGRQKNPMIAVVRTRRFSKFDHGGIIAMSYRRVAAAVRAERAHRANTVITSYVGSSAVKR